MSAEQMKPAEYIETQMRIIEMGKIADSLDLDLFLKCIANAETLAPIIDPTLFQRAHANLVAIKRLAEIALKMKHAYGEVFKAVLNTSLQSYLDDSQEERPDKEKLLDSPTEARCTCNVVIGGHMPNCELVTSQEGSTND